MNYKKCLGAASAALMVVIVLALVLAPSAWAQSKYKRLHKFTGGKDGVRLRAPLIFDAAGNLYGTTAVGGGHHTGGTVFKMAPNADGSWTKTILYIFSCKRHKCPAEWPQAGLIFDAAGNLYSTATWGGPNGVPGSGVVFKLTHNPDDSWSESVLYSFCTVTNCRDGANPSGDIIFDQSGNLYGTTYNGAHKGYGVVFKLTPHSDGSWTEKVLHRFMGGTDGARPYAGLTFDQEGNLYGTTEAGGNSSCYAKFGCGVVFKLTPNSNGTWTEDVLHRFTGKDGASPWAGLIFDQGGSLYGTTQTGGNLSDCNGGGCGVAFKLSPNSDGTWTEAVLHRFTGGKDGSTPYAGLTLDPAGNLYGTTRDGGILTDCSPIGCGVVFKLTPNANGTWAEKALHRFKGDKDGASPYANLIFDASGNLYGTTDGGNSGLRGSVFEITP
jgi:uncharacterized repeat protein (TIGR03803 family)